MQVRRVLAISLLALTAAACGSAPGERAVGGAGVGAATGAGVGLLFGGVGAVPGAVVGGIIGGGTGAVTTQDQVDLGEPAWK